MSQAASLRNEVETYLQSLQLAERKPANLYEPMAYLLALPAKRIRPLLCLMAYEAASGLRPAAALPVAAAVELFHNFTLMHDDIMDHAPVRRGEPTVHVKWDVNTAILSGDALFALTMGMMAEAFPSKAAALVSEFSRVAMGVCEGQMEDLDLAFRQDASISDYLEMIRKKTAVLIGGSLTLGALAGGASPLMVEALRDFGEKMGVAFQLQDDLMDAFPPEGFGKKIGGDIQENKKTYLLLRSYERASESQRGQLDRLLYGDATDDEKIFGVLDIYRALGMEQETRQLIDWYFNDAARIAETFSKDPAFAPLAHFLQEIARRSV